MHKDIKTSSVIKTEDEYVKPTRWGAKDHATRNSRSLLILSFKNLEKMRESKPYAKNTIEAMLGVNI